MPRLVLVNGAPGVGKSTIAQALACDRRMALALDVDGIKHSLGGWDEDPSASGLHARRLALTVAAEHLRAGYDVVLGQYLARTAFIEQLEALAAEVEARFVEVVLDVDAATLAERLARRASRPDRPEHVVNNSLVEPGDAAGLVRSIRGLYESRPHAIRVDASGGPAVTLEQMRAALDG